VFLKFMGSILKRVKVQGGSLMFPQKEFILCVFLAFFYVLLVLYEYYFIKIK
jgi:hypothetical protein